MKRKAHYHVIPILFLVLFLTYKPTPISKGQSDPFKINKQDKATAKSDTQNKVLEVQIPVLKRRADSLDSVKQVLFLESKKNQEKMLAQKKKFSKPRVIIKEKPVLVPIIITKPDGISPKKNDLKTYGDDRNLDQPCLDSAPVKKHRTWFGRILHGRKRKK